MLGGLDLHRNLLAVGWSDVGGHLVLVDALNRRVMRRMTLMQDGWSQAKRRRRTRNIGRLDISDLSGICIDDSMSIFVTDSYSHVVRKLSPFGQEILQIREPVRAQRRSLERKLALRHPNAVAVDSRGYILVACGDRPLVAGVQIYDREGRYASRLSSFGEDQETFGAPRGLHIAAGRIYVADTQNGCIQVFSEEGRFMSMFSTATRHGERSRPSAILRTPSGGLIVAQIGEDSALKEFDREGAFVRTIAEGGTEPGHVCDPSALAWDGAGRLYVADDFAWRVQVFDLVEGGVTRLDLAGGELSRRGRLGRTGLEEAGESS